MISSPTPIPFSRPYVGGEELAFIQQVLDARAIAGPGHHCQACEAIIRQQTGSSCVFVVPSCTAALEMSCLLLGIGPGDEVIMPSFTFVSNPNAVVLRKATPVFVDVDPATFNIDPDSVEAAITERTRAILVTHYAGVPAHMDDIKKIADPRGIAVVEDAAQAYGSRRNGRLAGTFAPLACFSFHGTKNISAGEAGVLVVNDPEMHEAATIMREKGTDRSRFLTGDVDFYTWQDIGSSQIVSEMTAAFLHAQLERAEMINATRRAQWNRYRRGLIELATEGHFDIASPPAEVDHNGHIFFLVLPSRAERDDLAAELKSKKISALTHYIPLHSSPAGKRYGRACGKMQGTERAAQCLLRLPLYHDLGSDQDRVIDAVRMWVREKELV